MGIRESADKQKDKPEDNNARANTELAAQAITDRENHSFICALRMKTGDSTLIPVLQIDMGNGEAKASNLMPKDCTASSSKPGQIKVELGGLLEAIPGEALNPTIKDLLSKLRTVSIEGGGVKMEGEASAKINADGIKLNLTFTNPSFDIVPDDKNPNCFHLKNIKGITMYGIALPDLSLSLEKGTNGETQLRISIPKLIDKSIPLDKTNADLLERSLAQLRKWANSPDKTSVVDVAAGILGANLKKALGGALDGIKGFQAKNDELELSREQASTHDIGGLKLDLAATVKAKLGVDGKDIVVKNIEGVSVSLPLPDEIAKAAGINKAIPIREVRVSEADKDGNRFIRIKTEGAIDEIKVKVDKDMKPCTDAKGNITVDFQLKKGQDSLGLSMTFNPSKLDANGKIPDFKLDIMAGSGDRTKLIESLIGKNLEGPLKGLVGDLTSISKEGNIVKIKLDKASSHDLNGSTIEASKDISFKLVEDGKGGIKIDNITGIQLKVNTDIPASIKKLGFDFPDKLIVGVKLIDLSQPDQNGNRRLTIENDSRIKKVSMNLGTDLKPAGDINAKYQLDLSMESPVDSAKTLDFSLRFNKSNQLDMSTSELIELGLQLAKKSGVDLAKTAAKEVIAPLEPLVPLVPLVVPIPVPPPALIKRGLSWLERQF